tara:strand:+ start:1323 stop:1757 length:435 start_codon:yes stop_codon:yes gene_type:complete
MFKFFKKNKKESNIKAKPSFDIELTGVTLAYEIARIDGNVSDEELKVLMEQIKVIATKVGKDQSDILTTIETYSKNSASFYDFVADINNTFSKEQKLSLLSYMWKTAYADGKLSVDEERLIKRLAELINIKNVEVLKLKNDNKS